MLVETLECMLRLKTWIYTRHPKECCKGFEITDGMRKNYDLYTTAKFGIILNFFSEIFFF